MHIAILSVRSGWHNDELCRALAERGHTGLVLPYEGLVARLGSGRGGARGLTIGATAILDAGAVLARFIPNGSLDQIVYRLDALHWIEAARHPCRELAARDRALGGQVLHHGVAAGGRPADARNGGVRRRGRGDGRGPGDGRRDHQADLRIHGARPGARERSRCRLSRVALARADSRGVLRATRDRPRRQGRPRLRRRGQGAGGDRASGPGRRMAHERVARGPRTPGRPVVSVGTTRHPRRCGGRRRLRGCGPAPVG